MRVLLTIPPLGRGSSRTLSLKYHTPHLGLALLASVCRANGYEVEVIDAPVENLSLVGFRNRIKEFNPKVVGFTAYTEQIADAARAAEVAKSTDPNIRTVIGGHHVTARPAETLEEFPDFDFAIFGEGEENLCELLDTIKYPGGFKQVRGAAYRNGEVVSFNDRKPFIEDLARLPIPAFGLFPLRQYRSFFNLVKNRFSLPI